MIPPDIFTPENLLWTGKLALVLFLGFSMGLTMADIDLAPPLPLKHRSAWTHGPLIPLALWYLDHDDEWFRLFSLAFLPGFALHLCYDMFPKAWRSIACISLHPIPVRIPGVLSFFYMWIGAITALGVEIMLLETPQHTVTIIFILLGVGISFKKYINKEPGGWPWPLNNVEFLKHFAGLPPLLAMSGATVSAGVGVFFLKQYLENQ